MRVTLDGWRLAPGVGDGAVHSGAKPTIKLSSSPELVWNGNPYCDPGTVLYLPGYPGTGATIRDFSGIGNHGTIVGATWTRLPSGVWTLRYDGNDYVNIDVAVNDLAATTKGTWMTWVMLDDVSVSGAVICFGDTDAQEYIFIRNLAGRISGRGIDGALKWSLETDNVVLSNGVYAHIALNQDGISSVLVVNGVQVAQTFSDATDKTTWFADCAGIDNGRIGCRNQNTAGNDFFLTDGNVALTKIINTNLTVAQVKDNHYNKERHLFI